MARRGYDEVVLLTGFPSFRARRMCEELLKAPRTFVHAVVHPKLADDARLALDALPPGERTRVEVLEGDAAALDLGLSGVELRRVCAHVDTIHHMAQITYLGAERATAEQVNVGATREIVEVARVCPELRCLAVHSTALVSGDRAGLVLEDELDRRQGFRNVVEETLARGEKLARFAMGQLPVCVLRPTIMVGDSTTGEVDRFDGPYFLILLLLTSPPDLPLPLPVRSETPLQLVPVDYVVRAAAAIARDRRAPGRTFHIGDPAPLSARRVFDLVAAAGGHRAAAGFIPANITKAILRTPGIDRFARSPRSFLDTLTTPVTYSMANTRELLADSTIRCPPLESYIDRLIAYVEERLRERRTRETREEEVWDPLL
ncbi:MAG: SDR family oxidoreductase [Polyangiaceae bacterium]